MDEINTKGDFLRPSPARSPLSIKTSSLSGKSSPRSTNNSPSFRRLNSTRTPRRDSRTLGSRFPWIRNNRVVFWLILITLWAYIGFHVQSQWAHGDHKAEFVGYEIKHSNASSTGSSTTPFITVRKEGKIKELGVSLVKKVRQVRRRRGRRSRKMAVEEGERGDEDVVVVVPRENGTYGVIVGPFGKTEDRVLGWSPEKRRGTCNRRGEFRRLVWSRSFMLVFHEMSMTGAPLSMLELATEMLSCGGSVSAIVLSRKGGLMGELEKRGIKVLQDREKGSFKAATKADIVIAGSAVCSSWIEPYLEQYPAQAGQIIWWIMENRREYFDRSKHLLHRVKMLAFISESQSKQWLSWCEEKKIKFYLQPMIVPLSVNEELAFVAGLPCSLNTPANSAEKMIEKRDALRSTVREEMGLDDNDMLVMSLSSINPGKGQQLLLEAVLLVAEHRVSLKDSENYSLIEVEDLSGVIPTNQTNMTSQLNSGAILQTINQTGVPVNPLLKNNGSRLSLRRRRKRRVKTMTDGGQQISRNLLSEPTLRQPKSLKVLIGSVGSKSNKVLYVKSMLEYLSHHSNLSKVVLWTPATTRVAALYAAADAYVINAQGLGETFGRVTIEAMAFGLPVLGTDAGGTKEIVDHRVTGLLHPLGHEGIETLAQHIQYLRSNPSVRKKMGMNGRRKVQNKYLKNQTYESFAQVLFKCMRPR